MRIIQNFFAGFAGAAALNILHQTLAHFDKDAPRVDLIGEEAVRKTLNKTNIPVPERTTLTGLTLAGDLIANTGYYATIGAGNHKNIFMRGAGIGLLAGIGALKLPAPMGLDDAPVNHSTKSKILTVALYTLGGIVTAVTLKAIRK